MSSIRLFFSVSAVKHSWVRIQIQQTQCLSDGKEKGWKSTKNPMISTSPDSQIEPYFNL